ncbi:MAG: hypothetical protein AB7O49_20375 [Sphingomonadales bacterium]
MEENELEGPEMSAARFQVDFNELVLPNVVLLSKGDVRLDDRGTPVTLEAGMRVVVWEEDIGDDGRPDYLFAEGIAVVNETGVSPHVKWCCLIDSAGIRHQSDDKSPLQ